MRIFERIRVRSQQCPDHPLDEVEAHPIAPSDMAVLHDDLRSVQFGNAPSTQPIHPEREIH